MGEGWAHGGEEDGIVAGVVGGVGWVDAEAPGALERAGVCLVVKVVSSYVGVEEVVGHVEAGSVQVVFVADITILFVWG